MSKNFMDLTPEEARETLLNFGINIGEDESVLDFLDFVKEKWSEEG